MAIVLLDATEKHRAIREVIDRSGRFSLDHRRLLRAVYRRELVETTGIGHGVAIAHGKVRSLDRVQWALGVSREGVDYHAVDGRKVHLLFVIASSSALQVEYLRLLCTILTLARTPRRRAMLDAWDDAGWDAFLRSARSDFSG